MQDYFCCCEAKCFNHHEKISNFYCFDEKVFLCDACFKDHKKHNIEVKSEILKTDAFYRTLTTKNSMIDNLKEIRTKLTNIKDDIEQKLTKINTLITSLSETKITKWDIPIFNLNYSEYESINLYCSINESMKEFVKNISELTMNKTNSRKKFYIIDKEVDIIEHSKEHKTFNLNGMLGKNREGFSLFEGTKNNYAVFNLNNFYYVKEILISVKQKYKCVMKNFEVFYRNKNNKWEKIGNFCCMDNNYEEEIQRFPIEKETRFIKINFIDTWPHPGESDTMLIKKLSFLVSDINF